jgi:hypothetical protein
VAILAGTVDDDDLPNGLRYSLRPSGARVLDLPENGVPRVDSFSAGVIVMANGCPLGRHFCGSYSAMTVEGHLGPLFSDQHSRGGSQALTNCDLTHVALQYVKYRSGRF